MQKRWSDQALTEAVAKHRFLTDVVRALQLSTTSGNFTNIKRHIKRLGLDTTHFCKNGNWARRGGGVTRPISDFLILTTDTDLHSNIKARLFKEGILPEQCQACGQGKIWNDRPLTLQINHIDGNKYDHRRHNLETLCPNCHTQTNTYGNKNRRYSNRA